MPSGDCKAAVLLRLMPRAPPEAGVRADLCALRRCASGNAPSADRLVARLPFRSKDSSDSAFSTGARPFRERGERATNGIHFERTIRKTLAHSPRSHLKGERGPPLQEHWLRIPQYCRDAYHTHTDQGSRWLTCEAADSESTSREEGLE